MDMSNALNGSTFEDKVAHLAAPPVPAPVQASSRHRDGYTLYMYLYGTPQWRDPTP